MENRFKYRGYDKDTKRWYYGAYLQQSEYADSPFEKADTKPSSKKHLIVFEEIVDWGLPTKIKVATVDKESIGQCTGLKDKNGKLIYEGDIVKVLTQCNKELHGSYSLQEIVWRNGNWVSSYISSEKGRKLPRGWSACFLHDQWSDEYMKEFIFTNTDFFCTYEALEIIGNIYENPELLEE